MLELLPLSIKNFAKKICLFSALLFTQGQVQAESTPVTVYPSKISFFQDLGRMIDGTSYLPVKILKIEGNPEQTIEIDFMFLEQIGGAQLAELRKKQALERYYAEHPLEQQDLSKEKNSNGDVSENQDVEVDNGDPEENEDSLEIDNVFQQILDNEEQYPLLHSNDDLVMSLFHEFLNDLAKNNKKIRVTLPEGQNHILIKIYINNRVTKELNDIRDNKKNVSQNDKVDELITRAINQSTKYYKSTGYFGSKYLEIIN